ncbi:MAG TPA: hypothetical protein PLZ81_08795 [Acidiphilium rubrum]|nr:MULTISPECIES: hypothetical protein [Acidiphilium]HQT84949.1 hypothetical protein [Acidiphilium rubrum]
MNPSTNRGQSRDRRANIHGVSTEAVEPGDDEYITGFQSIDQAAESWPLH